MKLSPLDCIVKFKQLGEHLFPDYKCIEDIDPSDGRYVIKFSDSNDRSFSVVIYDYTTNNAAMFDIDDILNTTEELLISTTRIADSFVCDVRLYSAGTYSDGSRKIQNWFRVNKHPFSYTVDFDTSVEFLQGRKTYERSGSSVLMSDFIRGSLIDHFTKHVSRIEKSIVTATANLAKTKQFLSTL